MKKDIFKKKNMAGATVLEMLFVVSILGILFTIALHQFSGMKENQVMKNSTEEIISALHEAQSQSLASVDSTEYGVHFQSDKVIIFKGQVFLLNDVNNKTINITSPANISDVTLNGISSTTGDIYFERLSGVPNMSGTITIITPSSSKIITISATGAIGLN